MLAGMKFTVEVEQEAGGRWIVEIPQVPGAMAHGEERSEAVAKAGALALRVLAERIEFGEHSTETEDAFSVASV